LPHPSSCRPGYGQIVDHHDCDACLTSCPRISPDSSRYNTEKIVQTTRANVKRDQYFAERLSAPADIPVAHAAAQSPLPRRLLGQTGVAVTLFGLGGEGVLRTYDRAAEAVCGTYSAHKTPSHSGSFDFFRLRL